MIPTDPNSQIAYIATAAVFTLCILWETFAPRRTPVSNTGWRWVNNLGLSGLTWYINLMLSTLFVTWLAGWSHLHNVGLLAKLNVGPLLSGLILLTALEFLNYWIHRAFHHVKPLWRLHAIHHTDTDFDVTTSFRHHPLEPLVFLPVLAPLSLVLGAPIEVALPVHLLSITAQVFSHSNARLPAAAEKILRRVILTPDFHRVHHCSEMKYTNSNFGTVVPWFDYLFGTARFRPAEEQEEMKLGLEYMREARDARLDKMLLAPLHISTD
ncbi:sterol desaturase family protein [Halioglobus maricola]|nr:sterol desaturase family protein [Halioglobus maricola]